MEIKNWSVTVPNIFRAPECRGRPTLCGVRPDGQNIQSSAIMLIDGRHVITQSGSYYELAGPPHAKWLEAMEKDSNKVDLANPLRDWV